jgi:hypothetical protein
VGEAVPTEIAHITPEFVTAALQSRHPGARVRYFLSLAMTAEERRASEGDLLEHYIGVRRSLGGAPLDLEEAWRAHRIHAGYLVLASFLSLVPPYNAPEQRAFSEAFRARATEAIEDLGAAESLRAALG